VNAIQRYELIRPILRHEKTPKQVSEETNIPISTIYRYLKRHREGGGDVESLADKSHANQSHPKWLARKDKDKIVQYKLHHPYCEHYDILEGCDLPQYRGMLSVRDISV